MKKIVLLSSIAFSLLSACHSDDPLSSIENTEQTAIIDSSSTIELDGCEVEYVGIIEENRDPFYTIQTPSLFMEATRIWLWQENDGILSVFSRGDVSDETVEYSVYEFSVDEKNCLHPLLYSNFQIEVEIVLNPITNIYDFLSHKYNYSEYNFTLQVQEYIHESQLLAKVNVQNNSNLNQGIFIDFNLDNYYEIPQ